MKRRPSPSYLLITVIGVFVLNANTANAAFSRSHRNTPPTPIAIQFELPNDDVPQTSVGGGVRGQIQFSLPGEGAPNTSVGGGTRGEDLPILTALVPPTQQGRTVDTHPTFYIYLPPLGAQEAFFSVQDEVGNSHYHTVLKIPSTGGVVSVTLPVNAPGLEVDQNYLWYFAPILPGSILQPDNYAVVGWVKRVNMPFIDPGSSVSPIERATQYATAGIWYDTLKILVEAQFSDPNNQTFVTEWHALLKQVGLEKISDQPLIKPLLF